MIEDRNPKWKLLIAACLRQAGYSQRALEIYRVVNKKHPENSVCLMDWIEALKELNMQKEAHELQMKLRSNDFAARRGKPTISNSQSPSSLGKLQDIEFLSDRLVASLPD